MQNADPVPADPVTGRNRGATKLHGVLVLLASLAAVGCFRATFVEQPKGASLTKEVGYWQHQYLFGLVEAGELDVRDVCGGSAAQVQFAGDILTSGASILSLGIYTPRKIYVRCQRGQQR